MTPNDYFSFDIEAKAQKRTFKAGQSIIEEGSQVESLIFVARGRAKCVETAENGVISLIDFLPSPCFLGDLELIGENSYSSGVVAVTECRCYVIPFEYREQMLSDVKFLRYLCTTLARKAVRTSRKMSLAKSYPLKNRLASFILDMQSGGVYSTAHTEAAPYLGVTYRHLLYVIREFVDAGLLQKCREGYRITDEPALKKLYITMQE